MAVQERVSARRLKAKVGRRLRVLVDAVEKDRTVARSAADAPEIDGVVYVDPVGKVEPGDFVEVKITRSDAHDLWARTVKGSNDAQAAGRHA
jgi:ribosomal protein S12 methylthiotransferase